MAMVGCKGQGLSLLKDASIIFKGGDWTYWIHRSKTWLQEFFYTEK